MAKWLMAFLLCASSCDAACLLPDYDKNCDAMFCHSANINPSLNSDQIGYFNRRVPKNIHQIWFGDQSRLDKKTHQWKLYAEQYGYKYSLWSERDDTLLKSFMNPENFGLMVHMRTIGDYWAASDIVHYELIKHFGGIYFDCDFSPPTNENGFIDLQDIINFHGLTLFTEHHARNIGTSTALFVANGLLISSEHHPVICSLVDQLFDNASHWYSIRQTYDAPYATGAFLLNKVINGCFNLVPTTYLREFKMYE